MYNKSNNTYNHEYEYFQLLNIDDFRKQKMN